MSRFLIVEDHIIVRQGLIRILHDIISHELLFDEASDGAEALNMVHSSTYDLVLLDISLPDQNGLNVLKRLHQDLPHLPVIILSTYSEEQYAVRALRAGAVGYVNKGSASEVLKKAIESALTGKKYVTSHQADLLIEAIDDKKSNLPLHKILSDRELEVISMLTSGKTLTQIALNLGISVKTVSTYRTRVLEKLNLRSNTDLVAYCIHNNFGL